MKSITATVAVGVLVGFGIIALFDFQSPASDALVLLLAIALTGGAATLLKSVRR